MARTRQKTRNTRTVGYVAPPVCLCLAVLASATQWGAVPPVSADGVRYMAAAHSLWRGVGYRYLDGKPETVMPPGYPLLVGATQRACGAGLPTRRASPEDTELAAHAVSLVASSLSVLLLYGLLSRLTGPHTALWATAAFSLLPVRAELSVQVLSESTYLLFVLAGACLWLSSLDADGRLWRALAAGATMGAAYLARPEGLLAGGVLALGMVWLGRGSGRRALWRALAYTAAMLLCVVPYVLWLHARTGQWALSGKTMQTRVVAISSARDEGIRPVLSPTLSSDCRTVEGVEQYRKTATRAEMLRMYRRNSLVLLARLFTTFGLLILLLPTGIRAMRGLMGDRWRPAGWLAMAFLSPIPALVLFRLEARYLVVFAPVVCAVAAAAVDSGRAAKALHLAAFAVLTVALCIPLHRPEKLASAIARPDRQIGAFIRRHGGEDARVIASSPQYAFYADARPLPLPDEPVERIARYARYNGARWLVVPTYDTDYHSHLIGSLTGSRLPRGVKLAHTVPMRSDLEVRLYYISPLAEQGVRGKATAP